MAEILEPSSRKRKLTAILHADVAGFSRLMGEDEAGTHRALGELRRAVDPLITAHGGRIVGTAGDSLLADFSSVVDALNCAIEMQRASRAINDPIPPERRLELRIGVNLGDVIVDGDDIFGDGVNIAARLEALAQPGTVCISQNVYDQVRNKLDLDYRPLGSHRVKNIAEPVRAYAVGLPAEGHRPRKGRRPLFAAVGIAALVLAGVVAWALYLGAGRELLGLGAAPKAVEIATLTTPARLAGRPSVAVLPKGGPLGEPAWLGWRSRPPWAQRRAPTALGLRPNKAPRRRPPPIPVQQSLRRQREVAVLFSDDVLRPVGPPHRREPARRCS